MKRLMSTAVVAVLVIGCTGPARIADAVSGVAEGRDFKSTKTRARPVGSKGGVAIDFADYDTFGCGSDAPAVEGARFVSVVIAENAADGRHSLSSNPLGGAVTASVTTWKKDAATGRLVATSTLLGEGFVELREGEGAWAGQAALKGGGTDVSGPFTAERCP